MQYGMGVGLVLSAQNPATDWMAEGSNMQSL
jgi:hypothetical protein